MTDEHKLDVASLRERFPGYFPPDDEQVREFITGGMVAFDTNALLDMYRFNPQARSEYLAALRKLEDRLFVPHRVGQELLERRLTVIKECATATSVLETDLNKAFERVTQLVRAFGNRQGLSREQATELEQFANKARDAMIKRAKDFYDFGMDVDASLKGDAILTELVALLESKVGPPLPDMKVADAEAKQRIEDKIPPGYRDAKKEAHRAVGDYLIWRQLLNRAANGERSVIFVTNEQKTDWVREDLGRKLGARAELVAEMLSECGVPFHLINVQSFLVHAKMHLGATVSDSTVNQAERVQETIDQDSSDIDPDPYGNLDDDSVTLSAASRIAANRRMEERREVAIRARQRSVYVESMGLPILRELDRILSEDFSALNKAAKGAVVLGVSTAGFTFSDLLQKDALSFLRERSFESFCLETASPALVAISWGASEHPDALDSHLYVGIYVLVENDSLWLLRVPVMYRNSEVVVESLIPGGIAEAGPFPLRLASTEESALTFTRETARVGKRIAMACVQMIDEGKDPFNTGLWNV